MGVKPKFEQNAEMERLATISQSDPKAYSQVSPHTKIALGFYLQDKKQSEKTQEKTNNENAQIN